MPEQTGVLLIQGFFSQEVERIGVAVVPIEGTVTVLQRGIVHEMFAGVLWSDDLGLSLIGEMFDHVGDSDLFDISLGEGYFGFSKKYRAKGRDDVIRYTLDKEGDIYVGRFQIGTLKMPGASGTATCILTEASQRLLAL